MHIFVDFSQNHKNNLAMEFTFKMTVTSNLNWAHITKKTAIVWIVLCWTTWGIIIVFPKHTVVHLPVKSEIRKGTCILTVIHCKNPS